MSDGKRKRELARADRVLPGVWRLRLPLPWPAVPHVNAYAISAGSGVVLFDTGIYEPGSLAQLGIERLDVHHQVAECFAQPNHYPRR